MVPYIINKLPNTEATELALKNNDGYCPCKIVKDASTKCICQDFREQFIGECACGLFRKMPVDYILYTKEGCPRCDVLKKELDRCGKIYVETSEYLEGMTTLPMLMTPSGMLHNFKEAMSLFPRTR